MAEDSLCDRCEAGTVYNDEGYPDYPPRTRCEHCAGTGMLVTSPTHAGPNRRSLTSPTFREPRSTVPAG
jgi:hypothetical protein